MDQKQPRTTERLVESLTPRERDVLNLLAEHLRYQDIADRLTMAISSVKWYAQQIYGKLGVDNRRDAIQRAQELGLLESHPKAEPAPSSSDFPTGLVTFLFTDIEGSTPLWEKQPEAMQVAVDQHHKLLRQSIEANGGQVFQVVGDAFQAAFRLASDGLCAALAAQQALLEAHWGPTGPLKVRMGLHTGPAERDAAPDAPYKVSHTLNRAARVMAAGYGGQILLSQETADLVERELPDGVTLKNLGEHRLKGMERTERLFQVISPNLPQAFPPLSTAVERPNNLPRALTRFIGREKEVGEVTELVRQNPLVTLTGPGGTGKTRLSLQAGSQLLADFPDGVFLVNLTPLRQPDRITAAIAETFSLHQTASRGVETVLTDYLSNKRLLLILDNFEQVIEGAPRVAELLSAAPQVKALVTSRERLRLSGEQVYPLGPLSLPGERSDLEQAEGSEAVRLFVERARAARPGFSLSAENAAQVVEICRRLDGMPLAIELAAARVRLLPPAAMLSQLGSRLKLLVGGARDLPARHQTMRAAIEWSVALLTPAEQRAFRRFGMLVGGCALEAVQAVFGEDEVDGLEVIGSLADKNLLREADVDGQPRLLMYETLREYALEQLRAAGEYDAAFHQYGEWLRANMEVKEEIPDFALLERELDNIRALLRWTVEGGEAQVSLQIINNFWFWFSHLAEGVSWARQVLAAPGAQAMDGARLGAVYGAAQITKPSGDMAAHLAYLDELLAIGKVVGDPFTPVVYSWNLGLLYLIEGDFSRALRAFQEVEKMYAEVEDGGPWVWNDMTLGCCMLVEKNYSQARMYFGRSLENFRKLQHPVGVPEMILRLGIVDLAESHFQQANAAFHQSARLAHAARYNAWIMQSLQWLACGAAKEGNPVEAARLLGAMEALASRTGIAPPGTELNIFANPYLAELKDQLSTAEYERAWQEGLHLPSDQIIAIALGEE